MSPSAAFWDKIAPRYSARPISDVQSYEHTLARTISHLNPGGRVLEVGCGSGSTALRIAPHVHQIIGTDISAKMIQVALSNMRQKMVSNADFVQADIAEAARLRGPFDAILAFNLLHLVEDIPAALAVLASALKPGGLLISKTPCMGGKHIYLKPVIGVMRAVGKAPYVQFLRTQDLAQTVRAAGFALLEKGDFPKSPPAHYIVARKS